MRRGRVKLGRVRLFQFQNVPRKFDGGDLHSEAEAEIGNFVFTRVLHGLDFAFDAALAKTAGDQDAAQSLEDFCRAFLFNLFGIQAHDFHAAIVADAAVADGFIDGLVGVLQADVFADHADADAVLRRDDFADDFLPVRHVGGRHIEAQQPADQVVGALALEHERHFVNRMFHVLLLDHRLHGDVAEHGNLLAQLLFQRLFAAADDEVGRDADFAQLGDRLLRGLGFQLARRLDERHVGDMNKHDIAVAGFQSELADGLQKRQALDVARRAADFGDDDVGFGFFGEEVNAVFDFVGDVRDHLDGLAEIFPLALVVEHGLINLAAGEIVEPGQLDVGEPLVMAQVEVGLRAVVEHINLAVLKRAHRTGVHVEVGIELLERHLESAIFEQRAQRRRRQALAQRTHHTTGYKYKLHKK